MGRPEDLLRHQHSTCVWWLSSKCHGGDCLCTRRVAREVQRETAQSWHEDVVNARTEDRNADREKKIAERTAARQRKSNNRKEK